MQNRQAIIFLVIAVFLGIGAVLTADQWLGSPPTDSSGERVELESVVVAKLDVAIGSALEARQLETVSWPRSYLPKGVMTTLEGATGRVLRHPLAVGEPILESALFPLGSEAGMIALIDEEMRAVSVKVDPVIGVAGFVKPGARVDVVATLRRIDLKKKLPYTMVILQDVRVLAIDQKLQEAKEGEPTLVSVVTLEVDPKQAQTLTYLSHEGRIQLALRRPGDHAVVKPRSPGVSDLLPPRRRGNGSRPRKSVQVIKGSNLSTRSF